MRDYRILGPLEVSVAGEPVAVTGHRQRALLARLLLDANRVVSTDRLIDDLWGDHPPPTAGASLQNGIATLRRLLGGDVLVTRAPGYLLRAAEGELDADRFRRLVEDARGLPAAERAARLRQALALWRGPPLADLEFESFASGDIRRLEEQRLAAVEHRIEADLELGRDAELVGELEALVAAQPLRERPRGQLMLALYRSGRQADALEVFQDARRTLAAELALEPGPALRELHGAILRQERSLSLAAEGGDGVPDQVDEVVRALLSGRLVPVLGGEAAELAAQLAARFETPTDEGPHLARVAQYVALMQGSGPLYDSLRELLAVPRAPTTLHRVLAALPPLLRERGLPHQLVVTTGYDLALEQAFLDAGEEFDVVTYLASGRHRGRFAHAAPDGTVRVIDVPNTYASELSLERRTVVLKLHGGLDREPARSFESFVVTEDDYIDYLAETDLAGALPVGLAAALRRSHLLFLGYGMRDWNLRVILSRVWGAGSLSYRSWAVAPEVAPTERRFWRARAVELVEAPLEAYADALARQVGATPRAAA